MLDLTHKLLLREKENTQMYVNGIIDSEQGYIFTNDYSYYARRGKNIRVISTKIHNKLLG